MHVVATAGHVDHGKSTLVRALTGTDPDRLAEERQRGLTIDLGFVWTTLATAGPVEFVDVPGHVRFVANMLAGVATVEAGLLCIDSREGWRTQTQEHLHILDLIGLPAGLVALTKASLVGSPRLAELTDEVTRRTIGTVLQDAPAVVCDAIEGRGMDELRHQLDRILADRPSPPDQGRARLWVDRSFTIAGAGTVVTGGVTHGTFTQGDQVVVVGAGLGRAPTRVRGIQALGRPVDHASPGSRAALNLAGLDRRAVRRGDAVVRLGQWHATRTVDATLTVLDALDHEVTARGAYLVYVGTGEQAVRLRLLDRRSLAPGSSGPVRLTFERALPLAPGDAFVLRETGRGELAGGGTLVDVRPTPGHGRRPPSTTAPAGHDWVPTQEPEDRLGVRVEPVVDGWVVSPATLQADCDRLLDQIDDARPVGIDVARLNARQRTVLGVLERRQQAEKVAGYAVAPTWRDELADHPFVARLERELFSPAPPAPGEVEPDVLRALIRRGLVLSRGQLYFAASVRTASVRRLAALHQAQPDGFTVSQARQALGTSRKWAVPLLELLDEAGVTLRRGDRRLLRSVTTASESGTQ